MNKGIGIRQVGGGNRKHKDLFTPKKYPCDTERGLKQKGIMQDCDSPESKACL